MDGTTKKTEPKAHLQKDDYGNTKLHYAAAKGDLEETLRLLQIGARVDPQNFMGWTPLMMAARNGHFDIVKTLLQNKADASKKNSFGAGVFCLAVASGNVDLLHLLLQHLLQGGVSKQSLESQISPISIAVVLNNSDLINCLLDMKFNINASAPNTGLTPLMYSAAMDNSTIFRALLDRNANPYQRNAMGETASELFTAAKDKLYIPPPPPPPPSPAVILSPMPQFFCNPLSPNLLSAVPGLQGCTPHLHHHHQQQVFFPPGFSPGVMQVPKGCLMVAGHPGVLMSPPAGSACFTPCGMHYEVYDADGEE